MDRLGLVGPAWTREVKVEAFKAECSLLSE